MADMQSLSRLRNPRTEPKPEKSAPKAVDDGTKPGEDEGEGQHETLEKAHEKEPGSKHVLVSHDGYGVTTHGIDENGEHDGPHDHDNMDEAMQHVKGFMGEEGEDDHDGDEDSQGHEDPMETSGNLY